MKVLHNVAKVNGYECRLSMDDFRALEANHGSGFGLPDSPNGSGDAMLKDGVPTQSAEVANPPFMQQVKNEFARIKILFSTSALTRLTILVWIIYAFDYWAFSVAGMFFSSFLACAAVSGLVTDIYQALSFLLSFSARIKQSVFLSRKHTVTTLLSTSQALSVWPSAHSWSTFLESVENGPWFSQQR